MAGNVKIANLIRRNDGRVVKQKQVHKKANTSGTRKKRLWVMSLLDMNKKNSFLFRISMERSFWDDPSKDGVEIFHPDYNNFPLKRKQKMIFLFHKKAEGFDSFHSVCFFHDNSNIPSYN